NGRPIIPAVPAMPTVPAVAHGSSNMNGGSGEHSRKGSTTISTNGPTPGPYAANGGPVGGPKPGIIQFGFNDSPAIAHSTPQAGSTPIPIPGNPRVPSPARSPHPIPLPQQSGGRPPSGLAQGGNGRPTFGSLPGEGDVSHNYIYLLLSFF